MNEGENEGGNGQEGGGADVMQMGSVGCFEGGNGQEIDGDEQEKQGRGEQGECVDGQEQGEGQENGQEEGDGMGEGVQGALQGVQGGSGEDSENEEWGYSDEEWEEYASEAGGKDTIIDGDDTIVDGDDTIIDEGGGWECEGEQSSKLAGGVLSGGAAGKSVQAREVRLSSVCYCCFVWMYHCVMGLFSLYCADGVSLDKDVL